MVRSGKNPKSSKELCISHALKCVEKVEATLILILPDTREASCQNLALKFPDVSSWRSYSACIVHHGAGFIFYEMHN